VLGLLGVDAEPGVVPDAELGGALRLELGQVAEVVAEAFGTAAVEAGPEGRLADGHAAAQGHAVVVIRHARDHVDVRVEPFGHGTRLLSGGWPASRGNTVRRRQISLPQSPCYQMAR